VAPSELVATRRHVLYLDSRDTRMFVYVLCWDAWVGQIALFVCCLLLLAMQLWFRPFLSKQDDGVATVAMVALLLVSGVQLCVMQLCCMGCAASSVQLTVSVACVASCLNRYVATVAASQTLTREHILSGRDVFILCLDVLLLTSPGIYLAWVNYGKAKRSIDKRLARGFLCFKPKMSKARRAMSNARNLEMRATKRHAEHTKHNPVAFTDLTPDQI